MNTLDNLTSHFPFFTSFPFCSKREREEEKKKKEKGNGALFWEVGSEQFEFAFQESKNGRGSVAENFFFNHRVGDLSWIVVRTQPRRERWAQQNITNQGRSSYCPRFCEYLTKAIKPLFPSYIFVDIPDGLWYWLLGTYGVMCPIMRGPSPDILPTSAVESLRSREDHNGHVRLNGLDVDIGSPVRMVGGPMVGLLGIYDGMSRHDRCRVLFNMLGAQTPVNVNVGYVRVAA